MRILVIDTSAEEGVLALLLENEILSISPLLGGPTLSKTLGLEVKRLLDLHPGQWDRIVLGMGPGSYTGIRVGAAMAQALSYGWGIPLYTVSSLSAYLTKDDPTSSVLVDARSGGFYFQSTSDPAPRRISIEEAETLSPDTPFFSPHPLRIEQRLPKIRCIPMTPCPIRLSLHSAPASFPLSPLYCS